MVKKAAEPTPKQICFRPAPEDMENIFAIKSALTKNRFGLPMEMDTAQVIRTALARLAQEIAAKDVNRT
jgi:hypothetical protein